MSLLELSTAIPPLPLLQSPFTSIFPSSSATSSRKGQVHALGTSVNLHSSTAYILVRSPGVLCRTNLAWSIPSKHPTLSLYSLFQLLCRLVIVLLFLSSTSTYIQWYCGLACHVLTSEFRLPCTILMTESDKAQRVLACFTPQLTGYKTRLLLRMARTHPKLYSAVHSRRSIPEPKTQL